MKEKKTYDVCIESMNPCGGPHYAIRDFIEVETDDPVAYAIANSDWPLMEAETNADGDIIVTTGDGTGYLLRFTFSC